MGIGHSAGDFMVAALDLGTTNCRLLVARPAAGDGFRVVDSFSRIVRLGEGLDATGSLGEAAMDRALKALDVCAAKLRQFPGIRLRAVATEACRQAANCADFVARVAAETGIRLEIIGSDEEARLVLAGCAPLLDAHHGHALVFDIGGGSTEVISVAVEPGKRLATRVAGLISMPHGVVSLTERFQHDPQTPETFRRMVALVRERLDAFESEMRIGELLGRGKVQMLGSSGTVTTLAAMQLGLARYDRGRVDGVALDFASIHRIAGALAGTDAAGRAAHPCIGPGRADLMLAGCAILTAICETWPVGRLRVADRGVREGILADLIAGRRAAA